MPSPASKENTVVFGEFLAHLRRQGFIIGVDHHLRLQQLLTEVSGNCEPSDLKTLLCPIFAINKVQQEQFHRAFDEYFALFHSAGFEHKSPGPVEEDLPGEVEKSEPVILRKRLYSLARAALVIVVLFLSLLTSDDVLNPVRNSSSLPTAQQDVQLEQPAQIEFREFETTPTPPVEPAELSFYQRYGSIIRWGAILAPLLAFLLFEWHRFNRRKLALQKQQRKKPPFVWPLRVNTPRSSPFDSEKIYTAARLMRRRQSDDFFQLDVDATVAATIESQGFASFRYKAASKVPEYLVLIDRASFRDHQARLFNELAKALEQEAVFVARYFYDGDPRVCRSETGESIHLVELQRRYAGHRLLVFTDGEKLIDPVTGRFESWAKVFLDWQDRALLTPVSSARWGLREITLADQFMLAPASLDGLLALINQLESPVIRDLRSWRESGSNAPPPEVDGPGAAIALRSYLGEETFQWLCACAVYPELHWDLTLYLGSLPCMGEELIIEENILRLIRLPWFRSGVMPDELRWQLIRGFDREKEQAVRLAIISLLEKNPPPKDSFAADAYRLNLVVQRWLYRRTSKRRREMVEAMRALPQSQATRDYTLLRFLESRHNSPLDLILPERLRKVFYKNGISAFGLKTSARLLMTAAAMAIAWFLVVPPAAPERQIAETTDATPPSVVSFSVPRGMAYVEGGTFKMGSDAPNADYSSMPSYKVTVPAFLLDITEVTNEQYQEFVDKTGHPAPPHWKNNKYPLFTTTFPVYNISWEDANKYAQWRGKRLPTEAEWEYAARGAKGNVYPWGNEAWSKDKANLKETDIGIPVPVGSLPSGQSWCGIKDLVGNVAEWVADSFAPYPGGSVKGNSQWKIYRGGSYRDSRDEFLTTRRGLGYFSSKRPEIGFRCAKDVRLINQEESAITAQTENRNSPAQNANARLALSKNRNSPGGISTSGILIGKVFDSAGNPIAGARVTVVNQLNDNSRVTVTNKDGAYRMPFLAPGSYSITASADGYRREAIAIIWAELNKEVSVTPFKLQPGSNLNTAGRLIGQVFDVNGKVIPSARVVCMNEANNSQRATLTDKSGTFRIPFLAPGTYTITASAPGYLESPPISGFRIPHSVVTRISPPGITLRPIKPDIPSNKGAKKP